MSKIKSIEPVANRTLMVTFDSARVYKVYVSVDELCCEMTGTLVFFPDTDKYVPIQRGEMEDELNTCSKLWDQLIFLFGG